MDILTQVFSSHGYSHSGILITWIFSLRYSHHMDILTQVFSSHGYSHSGILITWIFSLSVSVIVTKVYPVQYEKSVVLCIPELPIGFFISMSSIFCVSLVLLILGFIIAFIYIKKKQVQIHNSSTVSRIDYKELEKSTLANFLVTIIHILLYVPTMLVIGLHGWILPPIGILLCDFVVYSEFLIHPTLLLISSGKLRQEIGAGLYKAFQGIWSFFRSDIPAFFSSLHCCFKAKVCGSRKPVSAGDKISWDPLKLTNTAHTDDRFKVRSTLGVHGTEPIIASPGRLLHQMNALEPKGESLNKLRGNPTRAKLTKSTSLTGTEQNKGRKKRLSPLDRKRSMADDEFKEQRADNREKLPKQGRKHPKRKKNSPKLVLQGTLQGEESPEKRIKSPSSGLSTQTVLTGLPIDNKPFDFSPTGVEAWTDSNQAPNQDPENDPGSNIQHEPTPAFSIHPDSDSALTEVGRTRVLNLTNKESEFSRDFSGSSLDVVRLIDPENQNHTGGRTGSDGRRLRLNRTYSQYIDSDQDIASSLLTCCQDVASSSTGVQLLKQKLLFDSLDEDSSLVRAKIGKLKKRGSLTLPPLKLTKTACFSVDYSSLPYYPSSSNPPHPPSSPTSSRPLSQDHQKITPGLDPTLPIYPPLLHPADH
ncbi:uncharacterized protein LOC111694818 isoform X3 [Eurytemora carolleeae]|uniref:uncharacterized protein LOC111694818 isoform X2 n=1 Tax=Eurytemora carolleeae TaxID=1294199 RepID=UPI000C7605D3|nr:uncharacterized protein LOC111694818 isoform X2 [Eurytemora carolleeae]XP_023319618.1 uncharacterized protein LOC111694818 isoform X3 [Eurytemora carolleeae]|eukprot:XP_023319617.1 uncharacterized protein LOC111694818 isoform X2 [Eurytemora affinis]